LLTRAIKTRQEALVSLNHFGRLAEVGRLDSIKTQTIDRFIAKRSTEGGRKVDSKISPATINKDLRHIKAALRVAAEWGHLAEMPKIRVVREPEKIPTYVTLEHFELIYLKACPLAKFPQNPGQSYSPSEWWRALVTGMRIGELLALRQNDLDLDGG
jgi:integrase